jgi:hypothetical protein
MELILFNPTSEEVNEKSLQPVASSKDKKAQNSITLGAMFRMVKSPSFFLIKDDFNHMLRKIKGEVELHQGREKTENDNILDI